MRVPELVPGGGEARGVVLSLPALAPAPVRGWVGGREGEGGRGEMERWRDGERE